MQDSPALALRLIREANQQVQSSLSEPAGNLNPRRNRLTGRPTVSARAHSVISIATVAARNRLAENATSNTSMPISTNSTAFRISSISSQKRST